MITKERLVELFHEKLKETGSLDAALLKAVWTSYQIGYADALSRGVGNDKENTEGNHAEVLLA